MGLTEKTEVESVEVLSDFALIVKEVTTILRDGVALARSESRWCAQPGDDVSNAPQRVKDLAAALWTPEVVAAHAAALVIVSTGPATVPSNVS